MSQSNALFQHKDIAFTFLNVDHESLQSFSYPSSFLGITTEEVLSCLGNTHQNLGRWRQSVIKQYNDAFNRSGCLTNLSLEIKNFAELKAANQTELGVLSFLESMMKDEPNPEENTKEMIEKLRDTKRDCGIVQDENSALVMSIDVLFEELSSKMTELEALEQWMQQSPLIDATCHSIQARKNDLLSEIAKQEQMSLCLQLDATEISDMDGVHSDESIQLEIQEMALFKEMTQRDTHETLTKQERREMQKQKTENITQEMEQICSFLSQIGGTHVEDSSENLFRLKLTTDVGILDASQGTVSTRRFEHRLILEIDTNAFLVESLKLEPDEGLGDLCQLIGQSTLTTSLTHIRSLLCIVLTKRANLEAIKEFKFVCINAFRGVWRVMLSHHIEIEICVSNGWPFESGSELGLWSIHAPTLSVSFDATVSEIQQQHFTNAGEFFSKVVQTLRQRHQLQL